MTDRFPLLTAALSTERPKNRRGGEWPSQREHFDAALAKMEAAQQAGIISNKVYNDDVKYWLNQAIDHAWSKIADQHVNVGRYRELPEAVLDFWHQFNTPQLHTIDGYLKRASKTDVGHPLQAEVVALLTELAPLGKIMADLKTKIVKREVKPVEERKEGYHPPAVTNESEKQVVALLESITQQSYEDFKATQVRWYRSVLESYLKAQNEAKVAGRRLSPHDHFTGRQVRYPDHEARAIVDAVTTRNQNNTYEVLPEAEVTAIFIKKATRVADDCRMFFVHRNFAKIASIVEAKGNYDGGRVVSNHVDLGGMTGTLLFVFRDGSSFQVKNGAVYVVNSHGTRFYRHPLTFHNVMLPHGLPMKQPSQERMNTIFAKATA